MGEVCATVLFDERGVGRLMSGAHTKSAVQYRAWILKKTLLPCNVFVTSEVWGTLMSLWLHLQFYYRTISLD